VVIPQGFTAERLVTGEADLAVQQISELMQADGIDIVGPLPDALQSITVFSAGVFKASGHADLAQAFVADLASPAHAALIRRKGMEPV